MICLVTSELQIFHTNDLHSHLNEWPKIISLLKERRQFYEQQGQEVLIFDIGDHADRVHSITEATLGKANVRLMNEVGYDSTTIGNNEGITLSKEALTDLYVDANFPVLVANLFHQNGERPHWLKPYEIITMRTGLKIGVIGMTIPYRAFYEALGWHIEDPFKLLPQLVKEVRKQADIVIFLSHLGLNFDEEVANNVEGIDVVLGGHTHNVLEEGLYINKTMIHQAGKFGRYVGQVSLTVNGENNQIVDRRAACLLVDQYEPCEKTEKTISTLMLDQKRILAEQVVSLNKPLEVSWQKPSSFPSLLASALKDWCQAEIGMVNSGVILDQLPEGPVTKADLHRVCPHPINPCKVKISGKVLKETIQHALSEEMIYKKIRGFGFRGKVMGIMVFDGVTYEAKILIDGLTHIHHIKINGESINPERLYEVATIDMFTFGHLFPSIAVAKSKEYYLPELLRDLLAWKLKELNEEL